MIRTVHAALFLTALAMTSAAHASQAAPPRQPDAAELARALDRLLVVGSVLYVAAHPDDENTLLLAWLANDRLVHAGYLSITRGDGGQNLIGPEQGPMLGLIRTEELLAARRLDGAEQLFTRARDFGYSKQAQEALAIWGHDDILSDVVLAIRRFKPDVIITRFSSEDRETHGHHTASAQLAIEAYAKAADPTYHPDQAKRYGIWRADRIVWNASQFPGAPPRDFTGFVKLDVGSYDPMRGLSWGELSAESRSMHKSQGFGAARRRGPATEYFRLLAGAPMKDSPLEGVIWDWSRVTGATKLQDTLRRARNEFHPSRPEQSIPLLLEARDLLDRLPENPWKSQKRAELEAAVVACAGLFVEVTAGVPSVSSGAALPLTVSVIARRPGPFTVESVRIAGHEFAVRRGLGNNVPLELRESLPITSTTPLSNPYWLELPAEAGKYPVRRAELIGLPEGPSALEAEIQLRVGNRLVPVRRAVAYKWTDPVAGERYRAVEVLPPVTVDLDGQALLFPDARARDVRVHVRSTGGAAGGVHLDVPEGFTVTPHERPFQLPANGSVDLAFRVAPPAAPKQGTLRAAARVEGDSTEYDRGLSRIEYNHIPVQTVLPRAELHVVRVDVKRRRNRIGYVPGAGDETATALRQIGYTVVELDPKTLSAAKLSDLEAIVTGVRAWNIEPPLVALHGMLMDWVARGGTLVVQYNTNSRIGPAPPDLGPFPFAISHTRTTHEDAPVSLSKDPILSGPNVIGPSDFEGWVQERGLYFAEKWDPRYRAPLSMSDPGESPSSGALIVVKHGKGTFVYTGLALFRQLPAGVPGAYRILANLVEHGGAG